MATQYITRLHCTVGFTHVMATLSSVLVFQKDDDEMCTPAPARCERLQVTTYLKGFERFASRCERGARARRPRSAQRLRARGARSFARVGREATRRARVRVGHRGPPGRAP